MSFLILYTNHMTNIKIIESKLQDLQKEASEKIHSIVSSHELDQLKSQLIGKKSTLSLILKDVASLSQNEKPIIGKLANDVKTTLQDQFTFQKSIVEKNEINHRLKNQTLDTSFPIFKSHVGHHHPIHLTIQKLKTLFSRLGFSSKEGPNIETDFYNFEALNIDEHHPARDMHDTFYLTSGSVLRTHTSPVQIRTMLAQNPPIKIIAPGKVYRCDADVSHSPVFHQIEGLYVDKHVRFSDLKGILEYFLHELFGHDKRVRFRSSYFPFTEPSVEVDVEHTVNGKTKWMEIMGAGMVNRNVFRHVDYNPDQWNGFAFGIGIERVAMIDYHIDDIRLFYENDQRFIHQFH